MKAICDGMTYPGYLRPQDETEKPLRFRYRPVSPLQRAEFNDMLRSVEKTEDRELLASRMVAGFVKEWDARYPEDWPIEKLRDKPMPITSEIVANNIDGPTFTRLFNIVMGNGVPDPDPKKSPEQQADLIEKNAMPQNSLSILLDQQEQTRLGNSSGV